MNPFVMASAILSLQLVHVFMEAVPLMFEVTILTVLIPNRLLAANGALTRDHSEYVPAPKALPPVSLISYS